MEQLFCYKEDDPKTLVLTDFCDLEPGDIVYLRCGYEEVIEEIDLDLEIAYLDDGNAYDISDINPLGPFCIESKGNLAAVGFEPPAPPADMIRQTFLSLFNTDVALIMVTERKSGDTIEMIPYLTDDPNGIPLPEDMSDRIDFLLKHLDFIKEVLDQND